MKRFNDNAGLKKKNLQPPGTWNAQITEMTLIRLSEAAPIVKVIHSGHPDAWTCNWVDWV